MICNSTKHKVFMGVAFFGMLLYYPLASFLYPNLQIADDGDDLRYEPAFVVVETQSKLFLAGNYFLTLSELNRNIFQRIRGFLP